MELEAMMPVGERKDMTVSMNGQMEQDSLEYKDSIVEKLHEAINEFLEFSTVKELLHVVHNALND